MRLIDGDKLIDIITNSADLGGVWGQVLRAVKDAFIRLIRTMPNVNPEPQWTLCSERLPYAEYGESDNVLATCGYRDVEDGSIRWIRTLYFNGGNWCYPTGETYLEKVYAWMPLPECYRGDAE